MKRLLSLLLCILASHICFAQADADDDPTEQQASPKLRIPTQVGNYMLGANILFARLQFQKGLSTSYNIGLSPKFSFFILPNLALGLSLDLGFQGQQDFSAVNYGISPFARAYFAHDNSQRSKPLQFFVEGGIGFGGTNSRYESPSGTTSVTTNGARFYLLPGIDYFLNNKVALEAGLQYLYISGKPEAHILGLSFGVQTFLGN